jgi:hypothetical protein
MAGLEVGWQEVVDARPVGHKRPLAGHATTGVQTGPGQLGQQVQSGAYSKNRARVRTKVTLTSPRSAIFTICSGRSSRSKKRRRSWTTSHGMFHCKRNELSVRRRTHRERHVLRRSRFQRADHTAEDESAEMLRRDGNFSAVAWASGRNTSRCHSSTSAAVGSRSGLTSTRVVVDAHSVDRFACPSQSCLHHDSFRCVRSESRAAGTCASGDRQAPTPCVG